MLIVDPMKRMTIPEIRTHPWFQAHLPRYLAVPPPDTMQQAKKVCCLCFVYCIMCFLFLQVCFVVFLSSFFFLIFFFAWKFAPMADKERSIFYFLFGTILSG